MKRAILLIMVVLLLGVVDTQAAIVSISDVQVDPEEPSLSDIITFDVFGGFSHAGVTFTESQFSTNAFSLELDLFFTEGFGPLIPTGWSHSEEIGTLSAGTYDLTTQAYWRSSPGYEYILHDTFPLEFEVVPEPATILLFSLGGVILNRTRV